MAGPWERYGAQPSQSDDDGPWARYGGGHSAESQAAGSNEDYWRDFAAKHSGNAQLTAPVRSPWERFTDAASNAISEIQSPVLNFLGARIKSQDAWNRTYDPNYQADPLRAAQMDLRKRTEDERASYDMLATADPWNNPKLKPWQKAAAAAATVGGTFAGYGAGMGPLSLIGGGEGILGKMAVQAGVGGATDAGMQGLDLANNQRDSYDPWQTAMAAGTGAGFEGLLGLAGKGIRAFRAGREAGPSPEAPAPTVRQQLSPEQADALTLHGIDVDTLEDANMARKAADRLLAKQAPVAEAAPVIATRHGNIAPNADDMGRAPETMAANAGHARQQFEQRVGGVESGNSDTAKNDRSSASGRFQFTDDTFVRTYQRRFGNGESRESILAKKNDPRVQSVLMRDLTDANEDVMRRSGVPLTSGNYYLAHFAGAGGAVKLHRNLDKPVEAILGQKVVDANPFLAGMKGRDVIEWAANKMDGKVAMAPLPGGHAVDFPVRPSERVEDPIYRAPDHSDFQTGGYGFDPAEAPQRMGKAGAHDTGTMGDFENPAARQSRTAAELNQPGARGEGMATGGMERPFKADPSTGEFENVQRERVKQAEAETEKRFEARRAEAERLKAEFEARRNRAGQSDASARYQSFGTKPHYDPEAGAFRTTQDGFVADEAGNPVVWPTQGAAAKWAARFKMGGDFELQAHGTSKRGSEQPVTLQRKPGSTYGQAREEAANVAGEPAALPAPKFDDLHESPEAAQEAARTRQAPTDKFPADLTEQEQQDIRAQRAFEQSQPEHPGKEPRRPTTFFSDVANHLASESKRTGVTTKLSAEDAIANGVPADAIFHNPNDRYPTVKANAAKVFASEKAPLKSRGQPVRVVKLDQIGDSFDPAAYGAPRGDGVQGHRLAPEHAGDLLRRSMEGDYGARNQAHPNYSEHKAWMERMDALQRFEAEFGDDWTKLTDEQLAKLDPGAFDAFYDDVLRAAEKPDVDPFDPRFWENGGEQSHQGEVAGSESRSGEDTGGAERDGRQSPDGAQGYEDGRRAEFSRHVQPDAFGERDGDQRRALERKGEEPLRGSKPQKAPGSDGGLFDDNGHGQQGSLFRNDFGEQRQARIPEEALRDGADADRTFNWIAEHSSDEFHQQLANTLVDLTGGVKVRLYDHGSTDLPEKYADDLRRSHGAVIHENGKAEIYINRSRYGSGMTEETLLHEGIHAALATRIGALRNVDGRDVEAARGYGQDARRIGVLQKAVAAHLDSGKGDYSRDTREVAKIAAGNIDEFLTYAMTDKEFQRLLGDIELPDTYAQTGRLTAWQKFVNVARRMVGLDAKYQEPFAKLLDAQNAFHASIDTFNDLANRMADREPGEAHGEGIDQRLERRSGSDRREFGRAPRDTELDRRSQPERRQLRASDAGVETAGDRDQRAREDNERRRVESRTDRVVAGAKALLNDERGSLDLDKVAGFFVDLDSVRGAKDSIKKIGVALRTSTPKDVLAKTLDTGRFGGRAIASYFHSIDARMRGLAARFDSPTIRGLADMFHARAGRADATQETYHEAVYQRSHAWNHQLYETLAPFAKDADAMERVRNIITRTGTGSAEERQAAAAVAKLLKTIHSFRLDAGEDIGEVPDGYFPRVLNPDTVVKNESEFKAKAEQLFKQAGHSPKDAQAKAEAWFHQVVNENAGLDGSILDTRKAKAPGTTSGLPRSLHKDADTVLAKFYEKDPLDVLQAYITGSVKRAEFNRRFGTPGRKGSPERQAWEQQHGHKDQLDVLRDNINKEILASGKDPGDAQQLINDLLEANLGILGKSSTKFRLGVSLAHGYNQIAKMDHSLITSLNELAMGFVRHGPVGGLKFLGNTVKEFVRELAKMDPSEARRYAEHLGLVLNAQMDQTLQSRISAVEGTKGVNKVVSKFYRTILLHQFTQAERIAAAKMAREQINALAGDLDSKNARTVRRAERALAELGIDDPQALKTWLASRSGKPSFSEIDGRAGMAAKWSTAVGRMTNQTVMEPTRAVKPLWANHPLGSLLYGLMSYSFAFKKNVMDRAGAMAIRSFTEKDPHLLMPLLFGLPILGAFTYINDTYLRPALFGSSYDFAHETAPMAVLRAADRASMDGALSPIVNTIFGTKYTRSLSEAFVGSFAGSALQGAENIAVKPLKAKINGTESNAAARGQAGAVYDLFIEPAVDAAAVAGIGGKTATGIVYASGSRPGSIFPQDREAFIDAWAGPLNTEKAKDPFAPSKSDFDKAFDKADPGKQFDKAFKKASGE